MDVNKLYITKNVEILKYYGMSMESSSYIKYFYWIQHNDYKNVYNGIKDYFDGKDIPIAVLRQCESLSMARPVMIVPPGVWSENCYRQGSWFRDSDLKEEYLVVSDRELPILSFIFKGKIQKIIIENLVFPPSSQYKHLLESSEFKSKTPKEWFNLLEREKPIFKAFLERNMIKMSLNDLLVVHSINHANFLVHDENLAYNFEYNGEPVRSSLFPQELICSACMEIFGVIGRNLKRMIIKNCPGLKYIQMKKNEFLLVEIFGNQAKL